MTEADLEFSDFACPDCGLAGPGDVLEALARRLAPDGALTEAERLLREARPRSGYMEVVLHGERVTVSETYDGKEIVECRSLSEAYAELKGGSHA